MNKNNFYILHLSDLHIKADNKKQNYQNALKQLLEDIKKQTETICNIIVVVSGDIINEGNYENNREAAIKFFKDLYKCIETKVKDVIIVPGNHDKTRDPIDTLVSKSHINFGIVVENNNTIEWIFI